MTKHDIVFIAVEPFEHYTWRRRHHIAWRLAKEKRVLWIAPPIPSLGLIFPRHYNLTHYSLKTLFDLGRLKHQGRNLWVYCPVQLLPTWHKIPVIARLNKRLVLWNIRRVARRLGISEPTLWLYKNRCDYEYFGLFNEKLVVYDSYDKQTAFIGFDQGNGWLSSVLEWETRAMRKAGIVFAVSKPLWDDAKELNANSYLIPNGVDYDLFQSQVSMAASHKLEMIKKPILGYLGILHYMVDFDLLNYVAESRPDWSILLMGREWMKVAEDRARFTVLTEKENVYYVDEITREEIPGYLQYVDVCLMPMKRIELNRSADPLKLWEYLAAGKPVVAVDQGVEYEYHDLIKVAYDKEGFVCCIEQALQENSPELVAQRKRLAQENSWDRRVERMVELLETELACLSPEV
jgi:glycosyltransferase involved in cell wall biosynthesis